ncbi:MAG: J domain-containing protein [Bacteroidetes bacterium]|nr:J domain-containing protein [Bacteroidota bacterium]
MTNLYHILELEQGASEIEIKKAFRRLSKKYHPDSQSGFENAEKFRQVHSAYSILIDANKRKYYNEMLANDDDDSYLDDWRKQADFDYKKYEDMELDDYVERKIRLYMFSSNPKLEKRSFIVMVVATLIGYACLITWFTYPYKDIFSANMFRAGTIFSFVGTCICYFYRGIYLNNKKIKE